ncbi:hypothetical protein [Bosea rubneri]|uniref:Uncharacterized protein n=1 Tax=Bosea rubneri TaxID=3075434 RepID=A0ABU3SFZ9_9HYPH|nr:hypothetical protein [Bosea sp. ZW T0_25]MDU0343724.1 hypothetical protein [Bosea sp. ZW T0_25]
MPSDPSRVFIILDVLNIAVSADPSEGSIISMKVREGADVSLWLPAEAMAKLQAMMAQADLKHAKSLQPQ